MFADKVDCSERKSGIRPTGFIYSTASNGIKIGHLPGSVRGAAILAMGHYVPNINQTTSSPAAIRFNYALAILIELCSWRSVLFYKVDQLFPQKAEDLKKKDIK